MAYLVNAVIILFLLCLTSAGWYWLFKRFERRMSERFNDVAERVNEIFRIIEMIVGRVDEFPILINQKAEALDKKLDLLQGLLLVIKQDRVIDAASRAGQTCHEEGAISQEELNRLAQLLGNMRLDNLSRY